MIPILYEKDETGFRTEGLGRLADCTDCRVRQQAPWLSELELSYPVGAPLAAELQPERIVYAIPEPQRGPQPFRIYEVEPELRDIRVYARHVNDQLRSIPVLPYAAATPRAALQGLTANAVSPCPFTFEAEPASFADRALPAGSEFRTTTPMTAGAILHGNEGSILDTFGGAYEFDHFRLILHETRGEDPGTEIRWGKNLIELEGKYSSENRYTGVWAYYHNTVRYDNEVTGVADEVDTLIQPAGIYDTGAETAPTLQRVLLLDCTKDFDDRAKVLREEAENSRVPLRDLTAAQIAAVRAQCSVRELAVVNTIYAARMTYPETARADKADLNLTAGTIRITADDGTVRTGSLDSAAVSALQAYFDQREDSLGALFATSAAPFRRSTSGELMSAAEGAARQAGYDIAVHEYEFLPSPGELLQAAEDYATGNRVEEIAAAVSVEAIDLASTTEMEGRELLEQLRYLDTVHVIFQGAGVRVSAQVSATECDVLRRRLDRMTIGTDRHGLYEALRQIVRG